MTPLFLIVLGCLAGGCVFFRRASRHLAALDARCDAAAAEIDATTARRHALLPALVGLVRAFAPQERAAVDAIAKAHAAVLRATSPQAQLFAETRLGDAVRRLMAVAESCPQLQASQHFRDLRTEIVDSERKIAAARHDLGVAVDAYNAGLRRFPAKFLAGKRRLARRAFYDIGVDRALLDEARAPA